jgi:hypothetical protein
LNSSGSAVASHPPPKVQKHDSTNNPTDFLRQQHLLNYPRSSPLATAEIQAKNQSTPA